MIWASPTRSGRCPDFARRPFPVRVIAWDSFPGRRRRVVAYPALRAFADPARAGDRGGARHRSALAARRRRRRHDRPREAALDPRSRCARPLAARLPEGTAIVSATNGKTTTAAMAAEILRAAVPARAQRRRARTSSPASRRRSSPPRGRRARPVRGGRGARCPEVLRRVRPRARLPRQPLPRPARPLRRARARRRALARRRGASCPTRRALVVNGDDPQLGALAARGARTTVVRARRSAASRGPSLQHAADSKYCVRCGDALRLRGRVRRPPRRLPLPCLRARAAAARRRGARGRAARARAAVVRPRHAGGHAPRRAGAARPLQRLQRARAPPRSRARSASVARRDRGRARRASARRSGASSGSRSATGGCSSCWSRTRPARTRSCGRSSTAARRRVAVVALNDAIADGRDVSWIWDVDFEPLLERLEHVVATGERAAELALRFRYGGSRRVGDRGRARSRARARPRTRADAARRRARRPPHLHGDARAAADRRRPRARTAVLGARRVSDDHRVGHLYPDYLNIYADRGNIAVVRAPGVLARARARGDGARDRATRIVPGAHDLYYVGGGQDREQRARRPRPRRRKRRSSRERGRGRRRAARGLRRLPAARPRLPRPARRGDARRRAPARSRRSPASGG